MEENLQEKTENGSNSEKKDLQSRAHVMRRQQPL